MSAFLLWFAAILVPVALGFLVYTIFTNQKQLMLVGVGSIFLAVAFIIAQWVLANRAKCPLCMTPSLANRSCSRHRNARKMLGSYRLRVATTILFRNYFRCPYCGEPTALEVRKGRR